MSADNHVAGVRLLETGILVEFRNVDMHVSPGPDDAEFGVRVELRLGTDEDDAADVVEWGAFGFLFVLGVLSFADARARGISTTKYQEKDDFFVSDFLDCLTFKRGELHFHADYVRGRRMKTDIIVRTDGTVTLTTWGRGKAALRWLDQLKGKKFMQVVNAQ